MTTMNVQLPDWLSARIRTLAAEDQVSLDQFVATALAEKISALQTVEYLQARARRGDRDRFLTALNRAPDVEPAPEDRL